MGFSLAGIMDPRPPTRTSPGTRLRYAALAAGRGGGGRVSVAVVAEKPSVARDIARVLEARIRGEGRLSGNGYVVTWAVGHLVALAQPHEIHPEWKRWSAESLPLIPEQWPLVVLPDTKAQFDVVGEVLRDAAVDEVVC